MINPKWIGFALLAVMMVIVYMPFHYRINAGARPGKQIDSLVGWLMFAALVLLISTFLPGVYPTLSITEQFFVLGCLGGINLSVFEKPLEGRSVPRSYELSKWATYVAFALAILGFFNS